MRSSWVLEHVRRHLFWVKDKIKGNPIRHHLQDIVLILEDFNSEASLSRRKESLNSLLKHAVETTDFYSPYKSFRKLSDFPVITKMDIREAIQDFETNDPKFRADFEISTSGTTGIPFIVKQDLNKKNRNTADTFYFGKKGGYEIGDRLYYLRYWSEQTSRTRFQLFLTNIVQIHIFDLTPSFIKKLTSKMMRDTSNKGILGYSSALAELVRFMKKKNESPLKWPFKSIITMAEGISQKQKSDLETYFGASVVSRYSNSENGIFAQQFIDEGDDYHINWASYEIEVLDLEEDKPVDPGHVGRIVITDLFNYCMPIIRYDTGDLGILSKENTYFNRAPTLKSIEGRKMDVIYSTQGQPVSSYVAYEMEYFPEIRQFQLIQEGMKEYTIKVNIEGEFDQESEAIIKLQKHLGEDAEIKFAYVDELPQMASGKRRLVVNNFIR